MKLFKELVASENRHQLVLTIVLLCYIILNIQTPKMLANVADNIVGQGVVIILALSLFSTSNKILGLIGVVAAYEFIKRTSNVAGNYAKQFIPSQRKKNNDFKKYNDFPKTLEEEVVQNMPKTVYASDPENGNFQPLLSNAGEATSLH